jgi:hypothetical protein
MKVYFHKNNIGNFYVVGTETGGTVWWDACLLEVENILKLNDMKHVMYKKFASIKFENEIKFKFTDQADEAFFLVWSSDGIEI